MIEPQIILKYHVIETQEYFSYRFCLKDFQKFNQTSWAPNHIIILRYRACKKPTKIYFEYVK
jgi:hypothetical protein